MVHICLLNNIKFIANVIQGGVGITIMDYLHYILIAVAVLLGIIGVFIGVLLRKRIAERAIGSAEQEAKRIVDDATKSAQAKKKEALIEAKDEIHKLRVECDKEIKERRSEISRQERRINQKEETLDKKSEALEKKEDLVNKKNKELEEMQAEVANLQKKQIEQLEKIALLTKEEAKQTLIASIENEARHEAAMLIKEIEDQAK